MITAAETAHEFAISPDLWRGNTVLPPDSAAPRCADMSRFLLTTLGRNCSRNWVYPACALTIVNCDALPAP